MIQLYNKLMTTNLRVRRHARNWQIVSFMKNLFLEDELKYFFLRFYWDVCIFTLVKPIIMGRCGFHFAMTLNETSDDILEMATTQSQKCFTKFIRETIMAGYSYTCNLVICHICDGR